MFVFRNFTIENLFLSGTTFSGYGDISYIPTDEKEIIWFYQVPIDFDSENCANQINSFLEKLNLVCEQISSDQTLYICSLLHVFSVNDIDNDQTIENSVYRFNQSASELAKEKNNVKFVDVEEYFSQYPKNEWINWKYYFISQMIVSPKVAKDFPSWLSKRISEIKGPRKKCLILDLDNTVWGGILGEDGLEGIKIGGDYPGNAFLYFQEALISLSKNGVILSICSKNNEQDVLESWELNPFIKLNNKYISAYRINWNNKADNIREIAKELNIGLDSVVFIDDNPTERELVKQELPMVAVPDFPTHPYELMIFYKQLVETYFRVYELTKEDKSKTEQYKANAKRATEASRFTNIEDFIKSLDIEIDILPADKFNINRIAQMTQKTNQFNLTTHRYTEAEIESFLKEGYLIYCINVKDRFGDNGITGAVIIKNPEHQSDIPQIDSFLLSCRVLGKGIEDVFFKSILKMLERKGYDKVSASYIPTLKNKQVSNFFDKFEVITKASDNDTLYYTLSTKRNEIPSYYKINCR